MPTLTNSVSICRSMKTSYLLLSGHLCGALIMHLIPCFSALKFLCFSNLAAQEQHPHSCSPLLSVKGVVLLDLVQCFENLSM
jgi:hypothetical protein